MNRHITSSLAALSLAFPLTSGSWAQAPLPPELQSHFSDKVAGFQYPVGNTSIDDEWLWMEVEFDTVDKTVRVIWNFKGSGGEPNATVDEYPLGYAPTAYCWKTPKSNEFFVAGYIERFAQVIVERWSVEQIAIGTATVGGGPGPFLSTFAKSIRKEVVLLSNEVKPVTALAWRPYAQRLWMLEEAAPHVLWELDLTTGTTTALLDAFIAPGLESYKSAFTTKVLPIAPDGGGLVTLLFPWRAWFAWESPVEETTVYVLRDQDLDGVLDEITETTLVDVRDTREYFALEDPEF